MENLHQIFHVRLFSSKFEVGAWYDWVISFFRIWPEWSIARIYGRIWSVNSLNLWSIFNSTRKSVFTVEEFYTSMSTFFYHVSEYYGGMHTAQYSSMKKLFFLFQKVFRPWPTLLDGERSFTNEVDLSRSFEIGAARFARTVPNLIGSRRLVLLPSMVLSTKDGSYHFWYEHFAQ